MSTSTVYPKEELRYCNEGTLILLCTLVTNREEERGQSDRYIHRYVGR